MEFLSSLSIYDVDTPLLLEKRIALLSAIDEVGSISAAAKKVPLSYKAAWDAVTAMNNLCPTPVVIKATGGVGGGGANLTEYGKNLVKTYTILQSEHKRFLERLTTMTDFDTGALKSIGRVAMQISARNQILGNIDLINDGKVNCEVYIKLKSGYTIVSVITNNAAKNLNLKQGDEVTAIFKSSTVLVTTDLTLAISARNKLQGVIDEINLGEVNAELIIDIGNADKIASVITASSIKSLGLKEGLEVSAIIKASDILLGK